MAAAVAAAIDIRPDALRAACGVVEHTSPAGAWTVVDDQRATTNSAIYRRPTPRDAFPLFRLDDTDLRFGSLAHDRTIDGGSRSTGWRASVQVSMRRRTRRRRGGPGVGQRGDRPRQPSLWRRASPNRTSRASSAAPPHRCRAPCSLSMSTVGQQVAAGDRLVVVEAMKMEHVIRASAEASWPRCSSKPARRSPQDGCWSNSRTADDDRAAPPSASPTVRASSATGSPRRHSFSTRPSPSTC